MVAHNLWLTCLFLRFPQLAYKFGELVEVHAADTYAEFVEANEVRCNQNQIELYLQGCEITAC